MITIKLTNLVLLALSLDDVAMQSELNVKVTHAGRWNNVTGGVAEIGTVLSDINSRAQNSGGGEGWDQPKEWERACKRAYASVLKQLDAQGYGILQRGKFYMMQIVPKSLMPDKTKTPRYSNYNPAR